MGLLDKVKEIAKEGAEVAKKGVDAAQGKVEEVQTRKKADDLAKQLGYLVVKERSEGTAAGEEADRLVAQIVELEAKLAAEAEGGAEPAGGGEASE